jgi:guanine deaminase
MQQAIQLASENVETGRGGPFGAVVIKDGELISAAANQVMASNDPTAHAEVIAIRTACQKIGDFQLSGCELYTSCEPCPMCLGAIYWSRLTAFYYAADRAMAASAGFDDSLIYDQLNMPPHQRRIPGTRLLGDRGLEPFERWLKFAGRLHY